MSAPRRRWQLRVGRHAFEVRWWLLALVLAGIAVRLGLWQMDRAALKETLQRHYYDRQAMTPVPCALLWTTVAPAFTRVALRGQFVPGREYLWDNRTYQGQAGYEVLTPFVCTDGTQLLVDRGWIATGDDRERLPRWRTPTAPLNLVGFVFVPAAGATWLQSTATSDWPAGWPKRIGRLDLERMADDQAASTSRVTAASPARRRYHYPVIIDGGGSGAFAYNFEPASISPTRNRGYVVQWFALAAGILGYLGYRSWNRYQ